MIEENSAAANSADSSNVKLDAELMELLRCPLSHGELVQKGNRLLCYESKKAYRIEDGIPVMLIEEASDLSDDEIPAEFRNK